MNMKLHDLCHNNNIIITAIILSQETPYSCDSPCYQSGWNDARLRASWREVPLGGALPRAAGCPAGTAHWCGETLSLWCPPSGTAPPPTGLWSLVVIKHILWCYTNSSQIAEGWCCLSNDGLTNEVLHILLSDLTAQCISWLLWSIR